MHRLRSSIPLSALLLAVLWCRPALGGDAYFQYSTIDALLAGLYDGTMTIQDLKYQGDFGLGTLNGLDGELLLLDGQAYHVSAGGAAQVPADSDRVPFASVSFFSQDSATPLRAVESLEALNAAVAAVLPSDNLFYAIRIDGDFSRVEARAIPRQEPPYPTLAEAAREQVVARFSGPGTLVGYWSPAYVKGVGVPGFHWHFITADRAGGGHVLDLVMGPATARIDVLRRFSVQLPSGDAFDRVDLAPDRSRQLHAVETKPGATK